MDTGMTDSPNGGENDGMVRHNAIKGTKKRKMKKPASSRTLPNEGFPEQATRSFVLDLDQADKTDILLEAQNIHVKVYNEMTERFTSDVEKRMKKNLERDILSKAKQEVLIHLEEQNRKALAEMEKTLRAEIEDEIKTCYAAKIEEAVAKVEGYEERLEILEIALARATIHE